MSLKVLFAVKELPSKFLLGVLHLLRVEPSLGKVHSFTHDAIMLVIRTLFRSLRLISKLNSVYIPGEDSEDMSAAGQMETFLAIRGADEVSFSC